MNFIGLNSAGHLLHKIFAATLFWSSVGHLLHKTNPDLSYFELSYLFWEHNDRVGRGTTVQIFPLHTRFLSYFKGQKDQQYLVLETLFFNHKQYFRDWPKSTPHFFIKFVSYVNNSKIYWPTECPNVALEMFLEKNTLKPHTFCAGKSLNAGTSWFIQ